MTSQLNNNRGFSLIEVMVALAMLGAVSLGVMKLMEMQSKSAKRMDNQLNEGEIFRRISTTLANSESCFYTLRDIQENKAIKNASGRTIYKVGDKIGSIKIESINLSGAGGNGHKTVTLVVTMRRLGKTFGATVVRKKFQVDAKYKNDQVLTCYLDKENLVSTAVSEVERSLSDGEMKFKQLSIVTPDGKTGIKIIPGSKGKGDKLVIKGNVYIEEKDGKLVTLADYVGKQLIKSLGGGASDSTTNSKEISCPSQSFSMSNQVSYCANENADGKCSDGLKMLNCDCTIIVKDGTEGATYLGSCQSKQTAKACTKNGAIGCKMVRCPRISKEFTCHSSTWSMTN